MPRPRLSPEEREARRKARNEFTFSDAAYRHYDTSKGYGSPDEWESVARLLFGVTAERTHRAKGPGEPPRNKWLDALGLDAMPGSLDDLKKAFRAAMFKNHPDYGGSNEAARATMEAFETLKCRF